MISQEKGILYWNINKNEACLPVLTALVAEYRPAIVMLAECPFDETKVLAALGANFRSYSGRHKWVKFYATTSDFVVENDSTDNEYAERLVMAGLGHSNRKLLLVGVHLPSKLHGASQNSQAHDAQEYRLLIEAQEKILNIYKTIVFGDFNMNAYDLGMLDRKRGFRTVSTRRLAEQSLIIRKNGKLPRRCFYNPMWAWLGDYEIHSTKLKPAGTYFWSPSNPEDTHWNSLDAVIISPEAISQFNLSSLRIIMHTGQNLPEPYILFTLAGALAGKYSDHLPLYFNVSV